ncbi:MAG: hypothetical protein H7335_01230 [Massilia sp.]|nr:hypothetical protein [Massilia sp.]
MIYSASIFHDVGGAFRIVKKPSRARCLDLMLMPHTALAESCCLSAQSAPERLRVFIDWLVDTFAQLG